MPGVQLIGPPIEIRYSANLRDHAGNAAHAATYIRRRVIYLDEELRRSGEEHRRILIHEQFHFVWVRLGNPRRIAWEELLLREHRAWLRGEAGWSAEWRKRALSDSAIETRSRGWREYCCESFCDTAAWVFGGSENEVTLGKRARRIRAAWVGEHLAGRRLSI